MCFEISQKNHKSLRKNSLPKKVLCKKSCTLLGETIVALNQNINDRDIDNEKSKTVIRFYLYG